MFNEAGALSTEVALNELRSLQPFGHPPSNPLEAQPLGVRPGQSRRPKDALSGCERSFHGESQVQDRPGCEAESEPHELSVGSPVCKIMRQLPIEDGSYLYRIKCVTEQGERVAKEGDLALRGLDQWDTETRRTAEAPR